MKYTPNYELKKPEQDDFYDVKDFNDNADIIDQALKAHDDALATKETPAGAQAKANTAEANAKAYTDAHEQKAAPHSGHETPAGAQAKADAAETNAKNHANSLVGTLSNLLTTAKTNVVAAINEIFGKVEDVEGDLESHKAEKATETKSGHVKATTRPDGTLIGPVNVIVYPAAGLPAEEGNEYTIAVDKDEFLHKVIESEPYGGDIYGLALDDTYVYIGGVTTRKVYKLRKSDLTKVAENETYGGDIRCLALDDTYVYVGGGTTQKVYKLFSKATMRVLGIYRRE